MAIPFIVEDETNNEQALLHQIINELWMTLQRFEIGRRSRRNQHSNGTRARDARSSPGNRFAVNGVIRNVPPPERRLPPSMSLTLTQLRNHAGPPIRSRNISNPIRRRRRQPLNQQHRCFRSERSPPRSPPPPPPPPPSSSSSSSCSCYEQRNSVKVAISVEVTNQQRTENKKATTKQDNGWCSTEGILSKLVPVPFSGPIWTAVICVVGWHLLRTR